jgi:hypothetical protein
MHDKSHMELCVIAATDLACLSDKETGHLKALFNQVRLWLQRNWPTKIDHPIFQQSDEVVKSFLRLVFEGTSDPAHPGLVKTTALIVPCFVCN